MKDLSIPNGANLALAAAFVAFAVLFPLPPGALAEHLLFGLAALVFGVFAFRMGWMGGGAAKFNAVVALWLGLGDQYAFFVILTVGFGYLIWRVGTLLGWPDRGLPVNLVGVPVAWLLFLTTPMWTALIAGLGHFA